jgi:hypothetical protein
LAGFELAGYLGQANFDVRPYGKDEIIATHFYHLRFGGETPAKWLAYETDASDGTPGPIEFELWWATIAEAASLLHRNDRHMLWKLDTSA